MMETINTLAHPTGPEYQLLAGEGAYPRAPRLWASDRPTLGTYVLREDLHLASPPPHPLEAQSQTPNPLATIPQPATSGTKLSLLNLSSKSTAPPFPGVGINQTATPGRLQASIQEHPNEGRSSTDATSGPSEPDVGDNSAPSSGRMSSSAPAFGEGNSLLSSPPRDAGKRRKPKNSITKSNSSFISRCIVSDMMGRRLLDRPDDGLFAFANVNRAFEWLDLSSPNKVIYPPTQCFRG